MKEPVDSWDSLLIVVLRGKFNEFIREKWDEFSNDESNPTMSQMISFLTLRTQLEKKNQSSSSKPIASGRQNNVYSSTVSHSRKSFVASTTNTICIICKGEHLTKSCKKFELMSPSLRYELAKKSGWCINCLRPGHRVEQCSSGNCKTCNRKHHTLLHFDKKAESNNNHE